MPKLIKDGAIATNDWQVIEKAEQPDTAPAPSGLILVHVSQWNTQQSNLSQRSDVGVWLDSDDSPEGIEGNINNLPVIAVNFPAFADGRGFSLARLIRERQGYQGELRAIGHFMRDQLCYLQRCGFNAFDCDDDINAEEAISSLNDFTEYYQTSVNEPKPLFRRRSA